MSEQMSNRPRGFAAYTDVPPERTRGEIEKTLVRYKARGFLIGYQGLQAMVAFEMSGRRVRFMIPLPDRKDSRSDAQHGQAVRSRWRAALLTIKAKLESVESGIRTFEQEWLNDIQLPNGLTIGETLTPRLEEVCSTGQMPPLLPGPTKERP